MTAHQPSRAVAPGPPTFELHTLGWRAFQDLCGAVLREVWGQSTQVFADSNDAGRDGAFYGVWHDPPAHAGLRDLAGPFVVQCKHTRNHSGTLSSSSLTEEFAKVPALLGQGLCSSYVLMTNARVSGRVEADIRRRLRDLGVRHPLVLGYQWLCDTIAGNGPLRMFVPRVYGLGDLSQILDERAYTQASVLISSGRDQAATFVVTQPYRIAAEALRTHGFVLLLGEPAVGKSTIALMLALAAADNWGCRTVKARTASELVARWNPHEADQFIWVDDAFGSVRYDEQLTRDWARSMQHVMAAINCGARVVLTSRSYIYQDAKRLLKEYAYPRLREHQVTVNVEDLTLQERQQIVYNLVASGDQPAQVRRKMKPHLGRAARVDPFRPEMARRLGLRTFTAGLSLTWSGIEKFMARPRHFLGDVYDQFGADEQAALTLVYAAYGTGYLENPLSLDESQRDIIARAGSTPDGTARALNSLTGSFLQATDQSPTRQGCTGSEPPLPWETDPWGSAPDWGPAAPGWVFRHPTLFEGFAAWLSAQPHLMSMVLAGFSDTALLKAVDCEDEDADEKRGVLLRIPPALYRGVAERLVSIAQRVVEVGVGDWIGAWGARNACFNFLADKSGDAFLHTYLDLDPNLPARLADFGPYAATAPEPYVLARLYRAGLLSESIRRQAVERVEQIAIETPDASWTRCQAWDVLFTTSERSALMDSVRNKFIPRLNTDEKYFPSQREEVDPLEDALCEYQVAFEETGDTETAAILAATLDAYRKLPIREFIDDTDEGPLFGSSWHRDDTEGEKRRRSFAPAPEPSRSIFDDIDAE